MNREIAEPILREVQRQIMADPHNYEQELSSMCICRKAGQLSGTFLFGLTVEEWESLYYLRLWPRRLRWAYQFALTARQRARVGVRRIDLMLEQGI